LSATVIAAQRWNNEPASSRLVFEFKQAGALASGVFRKFDLQLALDDKGVPTSLNVLVDMASLDTQDAERDEILRGSDLFDIAKFPKARFEARKFVSRSKAQGPQRYDAVGQLTLRDATQPVIVALQWDHAQAAARATLQGEVKIRRLAFGVGRGEWQSTQWVGDEVRVHFKIPLKSVAGPS
jgi:polyisoprenoid-binding protein YceI